MARRGPEPDHYALLGVARDASPAEIRAAFRALARRWHPDFNPGDQAAERRMQALNVAFETLSCPLRRRDYDRQLAAPARQAPAAAAAGTRRARPMRAAEQAEAWARARAAREARARWEAARPRPRRTTVSADSLGPVLTAVTVGLVGLALFWHALPGPRPQPRLLAEALGLEEPRPSALARYAGGGAGMPVAPPSTEPRVRVVIEPPAPRASAGPAAPEPPAGAVAQPAAAVPDGPTVPAEPARATLAELAEAARRGEAAALAWQPGAADPAGAAAAADETARLAALGSAAEAAAAWRAAALADAELRRRLLDAEQQRREALQRLAALDAELESSRRARRLAEAAGPALPPAPGAAAPVAGGAPAPAGPAAGSAVAPPGPGGDPAPPAAADRPGAH
jgi:hypothetical protein